MEKKKILSLLIIFGIAISFYFISQISIEEIGKWNQQERDLLTAIVLAGFGILLHYIKKHPKVNEESKETADSLELLIMMVAPMVASFQVTTSLFHSFFGMPIAIFVMTGLWFVLSLIQINRFEEKDKKGARRIFYTNTMLFALLMVLGIFATIIGYLANPYLPTK